MVDANALLVAAMRNVIPAPGSSRLFCGTSKRNSTLCKSMVMDGLSVRIRLAE